MRRCPDGRGEPGAARLLARSGRTRGDWSRRWLLAATTLGLASTSVWADDEPALHADAVADAVARRTDPGGDGPFDPAAHRLIDLREITVGAWRPDDPREDLYTGQYEESGDFVRLDVLVSGLVNPPGRTVYWDFDPFAYGPHPVYGFVEIDMDDEVETGGELDAPDYHYLGNVARFGGLPKVERFRNRVALDESAFDGDFPTPPYVERHGEEFHLALLGDQFEAQDIRVVRGDVDALFESGEVWDIDGTWFHRAHGYEPFSLAIGGERPGEYMPRCALRLEHDTLADVTRITLVFPLTNEGAGLMRGEQPEPLNGDPSDQASVLEALQDLHDSAEFLKDFPTGRPEEEIIIEWAEQEAEDYLEPHEWTVTALLGSSYTAPEPPGEYFVWTDVYPNVLRGDVDGNGRRELKDWQLTWQFIVAHDADDGRIDRKVRLSNFARGFSVHDVDYDGVVHGLDRLPMTTPAAGQPGP